jgi:hypothetical protein
MIVQKKTRRMQLLLQAAQVPSLSISAEVKEYIIQFPLD